MAHPCPDCGCVCYCGGDIDDCSFEGTAEQAACRHCDDLDDQMEDALDDGDWDDTGDQS